MKTKRILYLIQFPPPVHGVSILNKIVWENSDINQSLEKRMLPIRFAKKLNELRTFRIKKLVIALFLYLKLLYQLIVFRPDAVYFSFMPIGIAFWRDLVYLITIKLFKSVPIIHLDNQGIAEKSKHKLYQSVYRFAFKGCHIIHVNEWLMNKELKPLNIKKASLYFVNNTVENLPNVNIDKSDENQQILFLSHLFPEKGADVLIDAFDMLKQQFPKAKLVIAGDAPSRHTINELKAKVKNLGLTSRITFTGGIWGNDKCKLIAESDIFVLPSVNDCFPLVILEALHYGIPVITTNSGGLKTIFEDNKEMIFIDLPNAENLRRKISALLENHNLRKEIGVNGMMAAQNITSQFTHSMRKVFANAIWPESN